MVKRLLHAGWTLGIVAAAVAALMWRAASPSRSSLPLVELEAVVASEGDGWAVAAPPLLPGPYRRPASGRHELSRSSGTHGLTCRVFEETGELTEEVRLRCMPDSDQVVLVLHTADGRQTLVALRRRSN